MKKYSSTVSFEEVKGFLTKRITHVLEARSLIWYEKASNTPEFLSHRKHSWNAGYGSVCQESWHSRWRQDCEFEVVYKSRPCLLKKERPGCGDTCL